MRLKAGFLACMALAAPLAGPAAAFDLFLSLSQGYTHYDAKDLNQVLILLEETTQEQGFNPYQVNTFDGHPQQGLVIGMTHGPWRFGIETEFWVEEFRQAEVPFDLQEAGREYRITCETLRSPGYQPSVLYGCVDAREIFNFLPITLQASYGFDFGRHVRAEFGYGAGIMAGSATIELSTEYFGDGAPPDDRTRFDVWPGVNPVQKAWVDVEYLPWRFMGITSRFGWRISRLDRAELRNQSGESQIFKSVFPEAREGSRMYIQSFSDPGIKEAIYVGSEADARARAARDGSSFHLVQGDFTGWFASLKLNFYWRGI